MGTDFASVPRFFVWFIPRYGRYTKAAIIHDHLWRDQVGKGAICFRDADGLFRQAMRSLERRSSAGGPCGPRSDGRPLSGVG